MVDFFYVNDASHLLQDAETRFEDQVSKLVLEKQELEWEKVGLGHIKIFNTYVLQALKIRTF